MFDPSTTIATSFLIFLSLWPVVTCVLLRGNDDGEGVSARKLDDTISE